LPAYGLQSTSDRHYNKISQLPSGISLTESTFTRDKDQETVNQNQATTVLPAIICTAFPFFILYLGTRELALSAWTASPVKVIIGRFLFTFVPTFVITLLVTINAFLVRRFLMKDKKNSTLICFGKVLLVFTLFIVLLITAFLLFEYFSYGYIT
ncbi:MAG: hypothetical protein II670_14195, partial [Alphaproteobacteria bacterium]|nr:hypothetical protein [Alphaproteobacteria bacterium]